MNGQPATAVRAGGYLVVDRIWENGDELRATLPMALHVHPMPDDDTLQAIMYGPLVLAGDLGREGLTEAMRRGGDNPPEMPNAAGCAGIRGGVATIRGRGSSRLARRPHIPDQGTEPGYHDDAAEPDYRSAVWRVLAGDAEAGVTINQTA